MPLKLRLALAADAPVDIAKVVGDDGIDRHQFRGFFQRRDGILHAAHAVIGPCKAVDDIALIGGGGDGGLDHLERLVQIFTAINIAVAKLVQYARLVGIEFQGETEICLGLGPLAVLHLTSGAFVKQGPVAGFGVWQQGDGGIIRLYGKAALVLAALRVAKGGQHIDVGGFGGVQRLQLLDRIVDLAHAQRHLGCADLGRDIGRIAGGDGAKGLSGEGHLVEALQDGGGHQLRLDMVRAQGGGGTGVEQHEGLVGLIAKGGCEGKEHLGQAIAGRGRDVEPDRFPLDQPGPQVGHAVIQPLAESAVDQGDGVCVAFQLAEDLDMGEHGAAQLQGGLRVGAGEQLVCTFEIAGRGEGKRLVVQAKGFGARTAYYGVEIALRLGHVAAANLGPGEHQMVQQGADGVARLLVGDDLGIIFSLNVGGQHCEVGDLVFRAGFQQQRARLRRLVHRAQGEVVRDRPLQ